MSGSTRRRGAREREPLPGHCTPSVAVSPPHATISHRCVRLRTRRPVRGGRTAWSAADAPRDVARADADWSSRLQRPEYRVLAETPASGGRHIRAAISIDGCAVVAIMARGLFDWITEDASTSPAERWTSDSRNAVRGVGRRAEWFFRGTRDERPCRPVAPQRPHRRCRHGRRSSATSQYGSRLCAPFVMTQLAALALFILLPIAAAKRFRSAPVLCWRERRTHQRNLRPLWDPRNDLAEGCTRTWSTVSCRSSSKRASSRRPAGRRRWSP